MTNIFRKKKDKETNNGYVFNVDSSNYEAVLEEITKYDKLGDNIDNAKDFAGSSMFALLTDLGFIAIFFGVGALINKELLLSAFTGNTASIGLGAAFGMSLFLATFAGVGITSILGLTYYSLTMAINKIRKSTFSKKFEKTYGSIEEVKNIIKTERENKKAAESSPKLGTTVASVYQPEVSTYNDQKQALLQLHDYLINGQEVSKEQPDKRISFVRKDNTISE